MYAVIETGGKQHRVELGSEIQVDRLEAQAGDSITLERVLLVADGEDAAIGRPLVDGATVSAQVVAQVRGDKVIVFKYKPKARTRVKQGFRAELTTLRITDIAYGGKSAARESEQAEQEAARKEAEAAKAERAAAEQAAAEKAAADRELAAKLAEAQERKAAASTKTKAAAEAAEADDDEAGTSGDDPETAEATTPDAGEPAASDPETTDDDSKKDG